MSKSFFKKLLEWDLFPAKFTLKHPRFDPDGHQNEVKSRRWYPSVSVVLHVSSGIYDASNGVLHTANGVFHTANGFCNASNGVFHTANGVVHTANGFCNASNGVFHTANGVVHTSNGFCNAVKVGFCEAGGVWRGETGRWRKNWNRVIAVRMGLQWNRWDHSVSLKAALIVWIRIFAISGGLDFFDFLIFCGLGVGVAHFFELEALATEIDQQPNFLLVGYHVVFGLSQMHVF
jgi:hypothetical protein